MSALTLHQGGSTEPRHPLSYIGRWRTAAGTVFKVKQVFAEEGRAMVVAHHSISAMSVADVLALVEAPGTVYLGR